MTPYERAQRALVELKIAIYDLLSGSPSGLSNAEVGRTLGIYMGHVGHEGHIPRTILALLESDGVVRRDRDTKKWTINRPFSEPS